MRKNALYCFHNQLDENAVNIAVYITLIMSAESHNKN